MVPHPCTRCTLQVFTLGPHSGYRGSGPTVVGAGRSTRPSTFHDRFALRNNCEIFSIKCRRADLDLLLKEGGREVRPLNNNLGLHCRHCALVPVPSPPTPTSGIRVWTPSTTHEEKKDSGLVRSVGWTGDGEDQYS